MELQEYLNDIGVGEWVNVSRGTYQNKAKVEWFLSNLDIAFLKSAVIKSEYCEGRDEYWVEVSPSLVITVAGLSMRKHING